MNIRSVLTLIAGIAIASCASTPLMAELVTNGGFEAGNFSGWTQTGNPGNVNVQHAYSLYGTHSGQYFARLGAPGTDATLSQDLATTVGQAYTLTFYLASNGSTPNDFTALFNNEVAFNAGNIPATGSGAPYPYIQHTFTTVATSTSTPLVFLFRNDPSFLALDDVSVVPTTSAAVPEPASLGLLGLGLAAIPVVRRLRRSR